MDQLVATVNGSPIDQKALNAAMQSIAQENFHATLDEVPKDSYAELHEMALERLVARELIFQAALAEGFVADETSVEEETARILRMMGSPKDFWQRLAERGMDEAAFLRMVRKDVTVDKMSVRMLDDIEDPGDKEIRLFFSDYPEKLKDPERVQASHILLPLDPEDPEKSLEHALSVKNKAEEGGFAEVAKQYSVCASAPGGGKLGYIKKEDVDPTFADAAFSQIVDEVGPPVRTPYGYHIILVTEHEIPAPPTLEESREKIINFLKKARGAKILEEWVAELSRKAEIVYHEN